MADLQQALQTLYRAPLASFVAERNRLAAALRAGGDEDAAKQLMKLRRPTMSAWTVNQLYWHARGAFDALLAAAARVRKGDRKETRAYREALAELRKRAAAVLREGGHAATGSTLVRVMGTLAGVAAAGGFDPDPPGALATDREPPGFEAIGTLESAREHGSRRTEKPTAARTAVPERERLAAARAEEKAKKQAEARARAREAERRRIEAALNAAHAELRKRERTASLLQQELQAAEKAAEDGREIVRDLERKLEALGAAD